MHANPEIYAQPLVVEGIEGCQFYHVMDLPGHGTVGLHDIGWDLRPTLDAYLGRTDFRGKRVLDVGAASGFLTFEMERRGAEVVSLDLAETDDWDIVAYANPAFDIEAARAKYRGLVQGRVRAYWLAHRLLNSRARAYYGRLQCIPAELGRFDTAMLGMVLGHTREPFSALQSVARVVDGEIVITEQAPQIDAAYAHFMPDAERMTLDNAWWATSELCRAQMLGVLGFEQVRLERAEHYCQHLGESQLCSTQVFRRIHPPR